MTNEKLKSLTKNLVTDFPRSPRETLGGHVIVARTLDKCRAKLCGTLGEYYFDCPLDQMFFNFVGIAASEFENFVSTGASDVEVVSWIEKHSKVKDKREIIAWNNKMRYTRPVDLPIELQEFLEGYIPQFIPKNRPVYVWFDVYDLEEKRM